MLQIPVILTSLWDVLCDLDDLTASTNSIMTLLAKLTANTVTKSSSLWDLLLMVFHKLEWFQYNFGVVAISRIIFFVYRSKYHIWILRLSFWIFINPWRHNVCCIDYCYIFFFKLCKLQAHHSSLKSIHDKLSLRHVKTGALIITDSLQFTFIHFVEISEGKKMLQKRTLFKFHLEDLVANHKTVYDVE